MAKKAIQQPVIKEDSQRVRFSLAYLEPDHAKFSLSACSREYFEALFRQILRYQAFSMDQFRDSMNADKRHPIYFKNTSEPDGFTNPDPSLEDLWTDDAWQFALPGERGTESKKWRVHGFLADGIFYVVWLDPFHRLFSDESRTSPRKGNGPIA